MPADTTPVTIVAHAVADRFAGRATTHVTEHRTEIAEAALVALVAAGYRVVRDDSPETDEPIAEHATERLSFRRLFGDELARQVRRIAADHRALADRLDHAASTVPTLVPSKTGWFVSTVLSGIHEVDSGADLGALTRAGFDFAVNVEDA